MLIWKCIPLAKFCYISKIVLFTRNRLDIVEKLWIINNKFFGAAFFFSFLSTSWRTFFFLWGGGRDGCSFYYTDPLNDVMYLLCSASCMVELQQKCASSALDNKGGIQWWWLSILLITQDQAGCLILPGAVAENQSALLRHCRHLS